MVLVNDGKKYEIFLSSRAYKFLDKVNDKLYNRIVRKIEKLSQDPFPSDAKRVIVRKEKVFRLRVGKYRITYIVFHKDSVILIVDIDKRPRIYR